MLIASAPNEQSILTYYHANKAPKTLHIPVFNTTVWLHQLSSTFDFCTSHCPALSVLWP